jgi:hypothetical protein
MKKTMFIFRKRNLSAVPNVNGTDVDFLSIPKDSLVSMNMSQRKVILYFVNGNSYSNFTGGTTNIRGYEYAQVTLSVDTDDELLVIYDLTNTLSQDRETISFDNVNELFDIDRVTSIDSIKRFENLSILETDPSSGGSSLPTGGVEEQVLTKLSATDGDADWGYPHTLYVTVRNVSGGTLTKGTPVHANDVTGNVADVIAADASNSSAMPCTYVLNEDINNNAQGIAILTGTIEGVDTSSFSAGDVVYVASGGGFTNVKPTGTDFIQNLGVVTKSNASTGSGVIYGTGRSNDVPNLPTGKFFIGSATNTSESAYTLPTSDGSANQVLQTDGSGAVTFETISSSNSVVVASQTAQVRLNVNDNYYTGNDDYGWAYPIWLNPSSFSTSFTDFYALMGIIIPKDLTTLDFLSTLSRSNGDGTDATVELFVTDRPNGSTANMTLTSIGSASAGALSTGVVYNVDIALTGLSLTKGQLLFVALKKTGGTNTTTYAQFNFTIIGS